MKLILDNRPSHHPSPAERVRTLAALPIAIVTVAGAAPAALAQTCTGPFGYELTHRLTIKPVIGGTSWFGFHGGRAIAHAGYQSLIPLGCVKFDAAFQPRLWPVFGTGTDMIPASVAFSTKPSRACAESMLSVSSAATHFIAEHTIHGSAYAEREKCNSIFKKGSWAWSRSSGSFHARGPAGLVSSGLLGFEGEFDNLILGHRSVRASVVVDPVEAEVLDAGLNVLATYRLMDVRSTVLGHGSTRISYDGAGPIVTSVARDMDLDIAIDPAVVAPGQSGEFRLSVRGGAFTRQTQNGVFAGVVIMGTPDSFVATLPKLEVNYTIPSVPGAEWIQFGSTGGTHADSAAGEVGDGCSIISGPGEGRDYADVSVVAIGNTLLGVAANSAFHALDFFTPVSTTTLEQVVVPFYQTNAPDAGSNPTACFVRIWDGDPRSGGTVIWDSLGADRLVEVIDDLHLYRVSTDLSNTQRAIKYAKVDVDGVIVPAGHDIGVEIVLVGDPSFAGPFIPVSPYFNDLVDRALTMNATTGAWTAVRDAASNRGACLGFRVFGRTEEECAADYNDDGIDDILDFLDFIQDFSVCSGSAPPCGSFGSADFNADDFVDILDFLDFIDLFATGCS
jgi:hypothetical protein